MGLEEDLMLIQGIMGIIALLVIFLLGARIVAKYFELGKIEFLVMGLTMIAVSSGWWGSIASFVLYAVFDVVISDELYIFLSYTFLPIPFLLWVYLFSRLVYPSRKRAIVLPFLALSVLYEILFFIYLFIDPSVLATRVAINDTEAGPLVGFYLVFIFAVTLITYTIFYRHSVRSDNPVVRLRGKLIYLGIIVYAAASITDAIIPLSVATLFVTRSVVILSAALTYLGWAMPERLARYAATRDQRQRGASSARL